MSEIEPLALSGKRVHFVGIGGCGMSGLARITRAFGATVTGSDMTASEVTEALEREGVAVALQQTPDSVPSSCDMLVHSAAVKGDHAEVREAQRRGLTILKYAQMLGRLMAGRTGVAIAGTHGKSTTTAMLAHALIQSGCDPTFIVGAICAQIGGGSRVGRADMLIAEACEYDRSFHNFIPTHSVVLNVEEDHLDVYGTLDGVVEAFNRFARLTPADGSLLIGHDGAYRTAVAAGVKCDVETIGFAPEADWSIHTVRQRGQAQEVALGWRGDPVCRFTCGMSGEHMAYNAAVAAVTAHRLGAAWEDIAAALSSFRGLDRRMQVIGERDGVTVVDDYGHHPTEIAATLRALRMQYLPPLPRGEGRGAGTGGGSAPRLICVFQPHQHSRTRFLLDQFAASFGEADEVVVPHIYFVRDSEADQRAVSAADLVAKLNARGVRARHIDAFGDIVAHLKRDTRPGDLVVVMGAGPVWQVAREFVVK
jgi:UDP-N-acetylmuramate--alanine ligase